MFEITIKGSTTQLAINNN